MIRRTMLISLLLVALGSTAAPAGDNPLLGTWRLKSFVREAADTGERYNQLGEHPDGYLSFSADGRVFFFLVSDDQPHPHAAPTDDERIKLHKAMVAYGGTYTLSPGKFVYHVDISWDGGRLGTDHSRFYSIEGDTLLIKSEPNKSPVDGREGVQHATFVRVRPLP